MDRRINIEPFGVAVLGLFLLLWGYGLIDYLSKYSHLTLWEHAAIANPDDFRAQMNCGMKLIEQKQYAAGLMYTQRAILIEPTNAGAYMNAHSAAAGLQSWWLAYEYGKKGFELDPRKQMAINLMTICKMIGRYDEARYYKSMISKLEKLR